MIPTRRFAAVMTALAPVWLLSSDTTGLAVAAAISGLALLAGVADALAIPGARQLRVRRNLPPSIGLGDTAEGSYSVESSWPIELRAELHDVMPAGVLRVIPPTASDAPWRVGRLLLASRGRAQTDVRLTGRQRGDHTLGDVVLRVYGPLGLIQRTLRYKADGTIAVVPSIAGVRRFRLLALQHRLRDAGVRTIRRRGEGASFANLREYVSGDDPRHIDWKASARRSKLITREFAIEQGQTVMIAIDAGRLMTQLAEGVSRFELALAAATVLADVATRSGDLVGLIVFNDEIRAFVPAAKGAFAIRRIRDAMIPLTATLTEPDYASAFRTLATRHRKRSLVVIFTDVIDSRASRTLIAHTARSAARHLPLVVALQNDELMANAVPREDEPGEFFRNAAAEELLLDREEALARMRQAGVSVLDVSPKVMTAAVVNRYLAIKARAAL
ncbi:MAG: DUF58 domain-containing protein [Gemmatimonadota bacterium]